jgi:hypothetical protein
MRRWAVGARPKWGGVSACNWWTGLTCRLCGERVKVTAGDAPFCHGLGNGGEAWAEHYDCRRFHDRVEARLEERRG